MSREGIEHVGRGRRPKPTCRCSPGETTPSEARSGEPGGNRTLNPQIKSGCEEAKTLEILKILNVLCANDGKGRHPGVTSTVAHERHYSDFDKNDSANKRSRPGKISAVERRDKSVAPVDSTTQTYE